MEVRAGDLSGPASGRPRRDRNAVPTAPLYFLLTRRTCLAVFLTAFRARVVVRLADLRTVATVFLADFLAPLATFFVVLTADFARFIATVAPRDAVLAPARAALATRWATFAARPSAPPTTPAARTNFVSFRRLAMVPPFAAEHEDTGSSTSVPEQ